MVSQFTLTYRCFRKGHFSAELHWDSSSLSKAYHSPGGRYPLQGGIHDHNVSPLMRGLSMATGVARFCFRLLRNTQMHVELKTK